MISTSLQDSKRIENQLKGRAGRQACFLLLTCLRSASDSARLGGPSLSVWVLVDRSDML